MNGTNFFVLFMFIYSFYLYDFLQNIIQQINLLTGNEKTDRKTGEEEASLN